MAYQVLARKWRPQTFEAVVGQEPITRTLQNALAVGRIAHAFLFSGPRGVGKTSVARILAKALNCVSGPTPHPDNTCEHCQAITNGSSLDVLEIDGASNRGIDEVRDLREKIKYLPAQGQYKVYIIDEVHMLTKEAFNALLKTLEEPPAHAVFILATTEPHKVPVTILSRCQRYDFRRIPTGAIQEYLARLAAEEGWHIDPEGLGLIARAAEGGLRDAQGFLDQVVTFGGEGVTVAEIARILGVTDQGALLSALEYIIDRKGPELLTLVDELYNQGHDLARFYQDLTLYARHLLLAGLHPEARHLAGVADAQWDELLRLARRADKVHLHNLLSVLLTGEEELKKAPQPRLALEVLLLRLIHLEPLVDLEEYLARLEKLARRLEGQTNVSGAGARPEPEPVERPQPPAPAASAQPAASVGDDLDSQWQAFLTFVQEKKEGPLYGKLSQCRLTGVADHRLQITPGRFFHANGAQQESRLNELARAFFGPEVSVELQAPAPPAPRKPPVAAKLDMNKLQQQALEIFGGHWLDGDEPGKEEPE